MPSLEVAIHGTDVSTESNGNGLPSSTNARMLAEAQSSYSNVDAKKPAKTDAHELSFDDSIYSSGAKSEGGDLPTEVKVGEKTVKLPEGMSKYELKDGLPSYTKNGVVVDLNENGDAKAYHSNGFSFEHHADNDTWYYHEDKGGKFVQIDVPTLNEDGSVSTKEHGGFNNGREHKLSAEGQSTENLTSAKLGRVTDQINLGKLVDAVKERSFSDAFSWAKQNVGVFTGIGMGAALLDGVAGTNTYRTANALTKGFGDTLIDGTMNGTVYLAGLAQGGLEKIGAMPDWKQIDQVIPKLDLYEGYSEATGSTSESIAYRIGQVGGFLVPFAGQAGGAVRLSKGAVAAVREGRVISTLGDNASSLVTKLDESGNALRTKLDDWLTRKTNSEASGNAISKKVTSERVDLMPSFAPTQELNANPVLALEQRLNASVTHTRTEDDIARLSDDSIDTAHMPYRGDSQAFSETSNASRGHMEHDRHFASEFAPVERMSSQGRQVREHNLFKSSQISDRYIQLDDIKLSPIGGNRIIIGRSANCDYQLLSPLASRVHGEIGLTDRGPLIKTLSMKNQTRVNGQIVPDEGLLLKPGDVVMMGGERVRFGGQFNRVAPLEYRPTSIDNAAAPEALRQSNRLQEGNEISERLTDGVQTVSHDVKVNFNQSLGSQTSAPVVFDVVDRSKDALLRKTIQEAHIRFDDLKSDPFALASELAKFSKEKLTPGNWSERMVDASYQRFLSENRGKRILLGNYLQMAERGEGAGVCLQQATLFKTLADDFGLDARLVLGHYGNIGPVNIKNASGNHAWNEVRIDGQSHIFDPRQQRFGVDSKAAPNHHPGREFERPGNTRIHKLNELNLRPGDQVTYNGSPLWRVSSETSKEPGHVVLLHDGFKNVSIADYMSANPGRRLAEGQRYELLRSNGDRDLGWIFTGRNSDGSARFKKIDAVKEEVPVAKLKPAIVPSAPKLGDMLMYEGQRFKLAQVDAVSGKPILFQEGRGSNFAQVMSAIRPEQLTQYRAFQINGKTVYANADLSAFYESFKAPNGQLVLAWNHEYVAAGDLSELQVLKNQQFH